MTACMNHMHSFILQAKQALVHTKGMATKSVGSIDMGTMLRLCFAPVLVLKRSSQRRACWGLVRS